LNVREVLLLEKQTQVHAEKNAWRRNRSDTRAVWNVVGPPQKNPDGAL